MKRFAVFGLALACMLSVASCASQKPSLDEVEKAIAEGNVTIKDALEKGWITQQWADAYIAQTSIPASNKMDAGAVQAFSTKTLSGEAFTREQMADVTLFAFLDPTNPDAKTFYQALLDGYEDVQKANAEILVCTKSEDENEMFQDAPFPVIYYNDSLQDAVGTYKDMIAELPNTASWCVNASFLSAWYSAVEAQELADSAASFVKIKKELESENNKTDENDGESSGMAVIG